MPKMERYVNQSFFDLALQFDTSSSQNQPLHERFFYLLSSLYQETSQNYFRSTCYIVYGQQEVCTNWIQISLFHPLQLLSHFPPTCKITPIQLMAQSTWLQCGAVLMSIVELIFCTNLNTICFSAAPSLGSLANNFSFSIASFCFLK